MNIQQAIAISVGGLVLVAAGGLVVRFHLGRRRADRVWAAARYPKLKDMGVVKRLTILPLIDRYTARDPSTGGSTGPSTPLRTGSPRSSGQALVGEPGVSYLPMALGPDQPRGRGGRHRLPATPPPTTGCALAS